MMWLIVARPCAQTYSMNNVNVVNSSLVITALKVRGLAESLEPPPRLLADLTAVGVTTYAALPCRLALHTRLAASALWTAGTPE